MRLMNEVDIEKAEQALLRLASQHDQIESLRNNAILQGLFTEIGEEKLRYVMELNQFGTGHDRSNYLRGRIDAIDFVLEYLKTVQSRIEAQADSEGRRMREVSEQPERSEPGTSGFRYPYKRPPEGL